ncbi:CIC11C00000004983 [Sungouiella intermedia]|uniref:CIC11C00000004983 n=1 Tax=Sungouiella intermedia TaxID=45354 RepID=A0A1L0BKC8_9ASCO|nr:CIC11C00000004983 [[Candida] intermedia]
MKFSSTLALSALAATVAAGGWNDTITDTYWITTTDYVTYCPYPTTVTVTTCEKHTCGPKHITVTEETTITVTGECVVPTHPPKEEITTDYVTYCPEPTTVTITTCESKKCGPKTVEVETPTTITVTGECIIPTAKPTEYTWTDYVTYCPEPTTITYSCYYETTWVETTCEVPAAGTVTLTSYAVKPTVEAESTKPAETPKQSTVAEVSKSSVAVISTSIFSGASPHNVVGGAFVAGLAMLLL